jgi:hypothetical protein
MAKKSPFPGMDPFIEASGRWPDFHQKLIGDIERALADELPDGYHVVLQERTYSVLAGVDEKDEREQLPDLSVSRAGPPVKRGKGRGAADLLAGAITIPPFVEKEFRESFIEVRSDDDGDLITCLEVLSPSNKRPRSRGWRQYRPKRNGLLLGDAHFIEIDLLLGGTRMPMARPWPDSPYYVMLCRKPSAPTCLVWPASYRAALPPVCVPLAGRDPDILLALQPLVDGVYVRSRYGTLLDYASPLDARVPAPDAEWIRRTAASAKR